MPFIWILTSPNVFINAFPWRTSWFPYKICEIFHIFGRYLAYFTTPSVRHFLPDLNRDADDLIFTASFCDWVPPWYSLKQLIGAFGVASISEMNPITATGCLQLNPVIQQETGRRSYAFLIGMKVLQPVWDICGCGLYKSHVVADERKFLYFCQTDFVVRQPEYGIDSH